MRTELIEQALEARRAMQAHTPLSQPWTLEWERRERLCRTMTPREFSAYCDEADKIPVGGSCR